MNAESKITRCSDCTAWEITEVGKGLCHLNPPQSLPIMTPNGPAIMALFPSTTRDDGCLQGPPKSLVTVQ